MLKTKTAYDTEPAALFLEAMLDGPSNPGGFIERQEARGQHHLANAREGNTILLPLDGSTKNAEVWAAIGVTFGEMADGDALFVKATVPDGWRIVKTDHSMWSYLADDQGRERASIFYKAAFYDRSAHMRISTCLIYHSAYEHSEDDAKPYGERRKRWVVEAMAPGRKNLLLWASEWILPYESGDQASMNSYWAKEDAGRKNAEDWLTGNYPDHKNPVAYWDKADWQEINQC